VPGAPGSLTSSVFGSTVILRWTAPSSGAAVGGYVVEAGAFSGARDFVYATGTPATSFTGTNVNVGTYFVRVRAANGAGAGAPSNEVIMTVGSGSGASPTASIPGPPSGLSVAVRGASLTFAWNAPAGGGAPTSYWIDAGSSVGLSDLASFPTGSAARSYVVSGVPAGTYYVRVRAVNNAGTSASSNEVPVFIAGDGGGVCSQPPAAPSGLRYAVRGSTVTVGWNAAGGSPTSYILEAGSFPGQADLLVNDTGTTATTMIATGVGRGTYFVRVHARNACGTSSSSNEVAIVVQ
jgi:predicted phage tail protein